MIHHETLESVETSEVPTPAEEPKPPYHPFQLEIENTHNDSVGCFTIPFPTTKEALQPFFEAGEITGWQDVLIGDIHSDIPMMAIRLDGIISLGTRPTTLDELNFLAARLVELEQETADGLEIFAANIEVGRNCGSIAEMINLTL